MSRINYFPLLCGVLRQSIMAHIMAQLQGLKQDPPVIKVYSRNNEDDNGYVYMLYPKLWQTCLMFNTVPSQGGDESHNAGGKDSTYISKAEAAKGINLINYRFQDQSFSKKAVATYGMAVDSFSDM